MKNRDLAKLLRANGFKLIRHGSNHDVYERRPGEQEEIPRHRELNDNLAKSIIKKWNLK